LIWVPNQTGYITARDLDAATASHVRQHIQQRQQQQQQDEESLQDDGAQQEQQRAAAAAAAAAGLSSWQLVPYGVTPALQQWMAEHQVGGRGTQPDALMRARTS
jgi:hypothetical protein